MRLDSNYSIGKSILLGTLIFLGTGCTSTKAEAQTSRTKSPQTDRTEKKRPEFSSNENSTGVVRSQSPTEKPVLEPITPVSSSTTVPAALRSRAEAQVRVVATVGGTPIYESEVREAVAQQSEKLASLTGAERQEKEEQLYYKELRQIIERELILDELFARLKANKAKASVLTELEEAAKKSSEQQMRDVKKMMNITRDEDFKMILQGQGVSISGMRRQLERNFMMRMYLKELLSPSVKDIPLSAMRDYYIDHPEEFQTEDHVKWQDIFINANKFTTRQEARQVAEAVYGRAKQGEDFMKLAQQYDQGLGKGLGGGETRGTIRPLEAEKMVFDLKAGEVGWVEMETGFHIIRIAERTEAGKRPFDEKTQTEIRRKLQEVISTREYSKIVRTLWSRNPPQLFIDP
jgi:parvulin-like peptidyl-prolyl isomerase